MNRSFPPPAREALRFLAGLLLCGATACTPNQGVKPGAPELIEFNIVQAQQPTLTGFGATTVRPDTPECATALATGDACLPSGLMADLADGGTNDANIPPDTVCRLAAADNWCKCNADAMDDKKGSWNCDPFTNVTAVIAVFDRLLDTTPLDPGDAAGLDDLMTADVGNNVPPVVLVTDYSATGAADGLVLNVFGAMYFANFRGDGPSLFALPAAGELPSGTTVMVSLNGDKVRAKDGHTLFKGSGQLLGGSLVFTMAPFSAALVEPAFPTPFDPMADTVPATLAFTNMADPMGHITATSNGAPIAIDVNSFDGGATYFITPMDGAAWPTGATIVITLDATTVNYVGQMIDAAATVTFVAP